LPGVFAFFVIARNNAAIPNSEKVLYG
jgi:hypothetical protein